jgi:hypothetical protein
MKLLTLIRDEAALALRRRFSLAFLLAALWLINFAPAVARGQDANSHPPPAGAEHAAPGASGRGSVKPSDAPPATSAPPAPPHADESPDALKKVAPEQERPTSRGPADADAPPEDSAARSALGKAGRGFRWKAATEQTLLFLSIQQGYALTQPKTRRDLHGPFFRDYFRSVSSLGGWADGGRFFTNYVAHPMEGALLGFVWVQNDPKGKAATFGRSKAYWQSRAKALAWSAAWSTQFELGPVSQASIGNVGLHGKQTWVDIVVTPTIGTAWLVAEDALDRYVIRRIERKTDNRLVRIAARMIFNPTRSSANLLRFEKPWRRDMPPRPPAASLTRR